MTYEEARNIVAENVIPVSSEKLSLSECAGRISAEDITAKINVPSFDRSPYDGFAFMADDVPATLRVTQEIRAGDSPVKPIESGTAAKILTGAMIPGSADAVTKYEETEYTDSEVTISRKFAHGENIIRAGEDVKAGNVLVRNGEIIDAGRAGLIASQGIPSVNVYRKPIIGIISTGNEITDIHSPLTAGKIYNTSRYTFSTALTLAGFIPKFIGVACDDEDEIARMMSESLSSCDALVVTGGVSAGDYDRMPEALKILCAQILVRDISIKPGGKCIYAVKNDKLICCLSGNPASALTNYYAIALPALKKLSGLKDFMPHEIDIALANSFGKKSPITRIIRGTLNFADGKIFMRVPSEQGNGVLSTMSGANVMAVIPAGSGKLQEGERLKGFLI